jgi:hypothetical protein
LNPNSRDAGERILLPVRSIRQKPISVTANAQRPELRTLLRRYFREQRQMRSHGNSDGRGSSETNGSPPYRDRPIGCDFRFTGNVDCRSQPLEQAQRKTAEVINYPATGAAARAVGATVTPTAPKPALEPVAPGPPLAQPAIPTQDATPRESTHR